MLSSLVPGAIFPTSGLNRRSTPTPREEANQRYKRETHNGVELPYDSPVSRSYDVANSSTSLIILNNKYGKNSTRLRGYYTGPSSERYIDPNRHRAKSPRNTDHHYRCLDSSSPKFEPAINPGLEWSSMSNRPPSSLIAKSLVNPRRHQSCVGRSDGSPTPGGERPQSRMSLPPPRYFTNYADMTVGETLYMWSIEKIYNVGNLKQLKQEQYRKLLQLEAKKGYHGYPEYAKYLRYINNAPNRTYGTGTGTPRSKSAYSNRSASGRTSPVKTSETRTENNTEKDQESLNDQSDRSDPPKRPQTSVQTKRKDDSKDDKQEKQENSKPPKPKEDKSAKDQVSRSPSRSSRSSIQKLGSMRSLRSKGSSKPSSRSSSARSVQSRDNGGKLETPDHKEGVDRPKSRLGRPDEGTSKSKADEDKKTDDVNKPRNHNGQANNSLNSKSSSSNSLDKKDKMGSISSLSSKSSDSSHTAKKPAEKTPTNQNEPQGVKVHRIPSAVELKDDPEEDDDDTTAIDAKPDNETTKTNQLELKEEDKQQPKDTEKSVKFSDIKPDTSNKTDEEKHDTYDVAENVNKSDDTKESEHPIQDDNKQETNKSKLSRQDSFDEDDDRRANRDLDSIEY